MEATAEIKFNGFRLWTKLSPLQAVEIAAAKHGFFDVDLVDNDSGQYMLRATAHGRAVTARGKTLTAACERMLEVMTNE